MNCEFGWVPSNPYPAITVIDVVVDNIPNYGCFSVSSAWRAFSAHRPLVAW